RDGWDAEAAVLALRRQRVHAPDEHGLAVARDDRRAGRDRRPIVAEVEAPQRLRREIGREARAPRPPAREEEVLRREPAEELEAVRPWAQHAVELAAALERQPGRGIDGVVRALGRRGVERREGNLGELRQDRERLHERARARARARPAVLVAA